MGLKNKYELKNKDNYRKYKHSIEIKKEAAMKIGIDNIRNSKLRSLDKELIEIKKDYEGKKRSCAYFSSSFYCGVGEVIMFVEKIKKYLRLVL